MSSTAASQALLALAAVGAADHEAANEAVDNDEGGEEAGTSRGRPLHGGNFTSQERSILALAAVLGGATGEYGKAPIADKAAAISARGFVDLVSERVGIDTSVIDASRGLQAFSSSLRDVHKAAATAAKTLSSEYAPAAAAADRARSGTSSSLLYYSFRIH
jgi:hypothetical protein